MTEAPTPREALQRIHSALVARRSGFIDEAREKNRTASMTDSEIEQFARAALAAEEGGGWREIEKDAARWRAFINRNGQEFDLSSGPGSPKVLLLRLDVSGLERWLASGAPDYAAMMNAVADDEIERLRSLPPAPKASP